MALTVAEVVAKFRADTSDFHRGTARVRSDYNQLSASAVANSTSIAKSLGAMGTAVAFTVGNLAAGAVQDLAARTYKFARETINTAARVQEMNSVIRQIGKTAGYTVPFLDQTIVGIKKMGITTEVAQNLVSNFIRTNLDLAKAQDIARVAQDAAVISGLNSSENLQRIVYGIQTYQTEVLRTAGLNINMGQAFAEMAKQLGKTTQSLTEAERQTAIMNAVIKAGENIAGSYAAAMAEPGKVLRSFPRYITEIQEAIGNNLLPAFGESVFGGQKVLKTIEKLVAVGTPLQRALKAIGDRAADMIKRGFAGLDGLLKRLGDMRVSAGLSTTSIAALAAGVGLFARSILSVVPGLSMFAGAIPGPIAGLVAMVATTEEGRAALVSFARSLAPLGAALMSTFSTALPAVSSGVTTLATALVSLTPSIVQLITAALPLIPVVTNLASAISGPLVAAVNAVAGPITAVSGFLASHRTLVLAAAAAWVVFRARLLIAPLIHAVAESIAYASGATMQFSRAAPMAAAGMRAFSAAITGVLAGLLLYQSAIMDAKSAGAEMRAELEGTYNTNSLESARTAMEQSKKTAAELKKQGEAAVRAGNDTLKPWKQYSDYKLAQKFAEEGKAAAEFYTTAKQGVENFTNAYKRLQSVGINRNQADELAKSLGVDFSRGSADDIMRVIQARNKALTEMGAASDTATKKVEADAKAQADAMKKLADKIQSVFDFDKLAFPLEDLAPTFAKLGHEFSALTPLMAMAQSAVDAFTRSGHSLSAGINNESIAAIQSMLAAVDGNLVPAFKVARSSVLGLYDQAHLLSAELAYQQTVLRDAATAVTLAESEYAGLQQQLQHVNDEASRLQDLLRNPLAGEGALADAKFSIDQDIARVRLELNKLKQAGVSPEDIQLTNLQTALEQLQLRAEEVDLRKTLEFDPLRRQIEQTVDTSRELTFDEAINAAQRIVNLRTEQDNLNNSVFEAKVKLDATKSAYEAQKTTVDNLAEALSATKDRISELQGAIQTMVDIAKSKFGEMAQAAADAVAAITESVTAEAPKMKQQGVIMGLDIASGIAAGVYQNGYEIGKALSDVGFEAVKKARSDLYIASPSRLTADLIGRPMGLGVASGLDSSIRDAANSARNLAMSTVGAMSGFDPTGLALPTPPQVHPGDASFHNAGGGSTTIALTVNTILDGKVISSKTVKGTRAELMRQGSNNGGEIFLGNE